MPAARQAGEAPRGTRKNVTDLTGREDERLRNENEALLDEQAERMSMVNASSRRSNREVIDYTDEARPKVAPKPVEAPVGPPQNYRVRLMADIENMTFGKEIIDPGDFTDPNSPRMPVLGSLKTYDFKEGREYIVDEPLYIHLRDLGYVYE